MDKNEFNLFAALDINPIKGYTKQQVADALVARIRDLNRRINFLTAAQKADLAELKKASATLQSPQADDLLRRHANEYIVRVKAERQRQADEVLKDGAFYAPGGRIDPEVLKDLDEKYDMLSDTDILQILGVTTSTPTKPVESSLGQGEELDNTTWNRIVTHLATVGHKDLYDVLGVRSNASTQTITDAHSRLYAEWSPRINNDRKVAMVDLLGFCRTILTDETKRKQYNTSLMLQRFAPVKEKIVRLGLGATKVVLPEQHQLLFDECKAIGFTEAQAESLIAAEAQRAGVLLMPLQPVQSQLQPQPKAQPKAKPTTQQPTQPTQPTTQSQPRRRQQQSQPRRRQQQQPWQQPWQQPQPQTQQPDNRRFTSSAPDNYRQTCVLLLVLSVMCCSVFSLPVAGYALWCSYQTDKYFQDGFPALATKYSERTKTLNKWSAYLIFGTFTMMGLLTGTE